MSKRKIIKMRPTRSIVASCMNPTREEVFRAAVAYVRAGISLYPVQCDGSGKPVIHLLPRNPVTGRPEWNPFKRQLPTMADLREWFLGNWTTDEYAFAVITGAVSGNLEMIDIDDSVTMESWLALVEAKAPGLINRLVQVVTPRPGLHVYYRCSEIGRCHTLAKVLDPESPDLASKAIIEIKGEGGSGLTPPTPASCHKSGKCYFYKGTMDLTQVQTISIAEREILLEAAKSFNKWVSPHQLNVTNSRSPRKGTTGRPGDDFNARASWSDVLLPHRWTFVQTNSNGSELWRRPGSTTHSSSASANFEGTDLLHVFSPNAYPFEADTSYTKFHAYTLLNHKGDFRSAAEELAQQGYGRRRAPGRRCRGTKARQRPNRYR